MPSPTRGPGASQQPSSQPVRREHRHKINLLRDQKIERRVLESPRQCVSYMHYSTPEEEEEADEAEEMWWRKRETASCPPSRVGVKEE